MIHNEVSNPVEPENKSVKYMSEQEWILNEAKAYRARVQGKEVHVVRDPAMDGSDVCALEISSDDDEDTEKEYVFPKVPEGMERVSMPEIGRGEDSIGIPIFKGGDNYLIPSKDVAEVEAKVEEYEEVEGSGSQREKDLYAWFQTHLESYTDIDLDA